MVDDETANYIHMYVFACRTSRKHPKAKGESHENYYLFYQDLSIILQHAAMLWVFLFSSLNKSQIHVKGASSSFINI